MPEVAPQGLDVRTIFQSVGRSVQTLLWLALVAGGLTAVGLWLWPQRYEGVTVLVPVQGSRRGVELSGAASILGGSIDLSSSGFDATRDVVSYLLRSRTVLLSAAATPYNGQPLSVAVVNRAPEPGKEEALLSALRGKVRVTSSKETGFVTMAVQSADSGAVRALSQEVVTGAQRLFADVAQAQAGQLLRAQERRLDSAKAELKRAEDALADFDERNRVVTPRSRLSLDRIRLDRAAMDAARAYEEVVSDRQAAIAHRLEDAPALAVVEGLPQLLSPKRKRILFRSLLVSLSAGAVGLLLLLTRELIRSAPALDRRPA